MRRTLIVALTVGLSVALAAPAQASVAFQNNGVKAGWNSADPQRADSITDVSIQQWATETPGSPWLGMNITGSRRR